MTDRSPKWFNIKVYVVKSQTSESWENGNGLLKCRNISHCLCCYSECCDALCAMAQRSQDRVTSPGLTLRRPSPGCLRRMRPASAPSVSPSPQTQTGTPRRRKLRNSGTHRNIPRSSRSDSGKNICRNVISWNTVKSSTNRGKCHLTVWNIPRWHDKPWDFSCKVWLKS